MGFFFKAQGGGQKASGILAVFCSEDESRGYGLIVRTNAAEAEKEELLRELMFLREEFFRVMRDGRPEPCYSLLYRTPGVCLEAVRDAYSRELEEIVNR